MLYAVWFMPFKLALKRRTGCESAIEIKIGVDEGLKRTAASTSTLSSTRLVQEQNG